MVKIMNKVQDAKQIISHINKKKITLQLVKIKLWDTYYQGKVIELSRQKDELDYLRINYNYDNTRFISAKYGNLKKAEWYFHC